jgi:hypothetical protein
MTLRLGYGNFSVQEVAPKVYARSKLEFAWVDCSFPSFFSTSLSLKK